MQFSSMNLFLIFFGYNWNYCLSSSALHICFVSKTTIDSTAVYIMLTMVHPEFPLLLSQETIHCTFLLITM